MALEDYVPKTQATCSRCGEALTPDHWCPDRKLKRDALLEEREKTHGNFENNAVFSQEIKAIIKIAQEQMPNGMHVVHREALDMIALKLSRILSGQAHFKDHWDDIAGYARLAAEACPLMGTKDVTLKDSPSR